MATGGIPSLTNASTSADDPESSANSAATEAVSSEPPTNPQSDQDEITESPVATVTPTPDNLIADVPEPSDSLSNAEETSVEDENPIEDMDALLASVGQQDLRPLRRGEVVEGSVMAIERDSLLVDIGYKSEGVVPVQEMLSMGAEPLTKFQMGENVLVFVIQPETTAGQVGLSIDRARGEQGWRVLQDRFESGDVFEAEITGFNKGGLLANVEGVNAFIPMSQVVGAKPGSDGTNPLSAQVGRELQLKVIEINRRRNRVILSERAALQEWRAEQKDRLLEELTEGEIRTGNIASIRNFGVFVDLGGADGLVHLSELSWERNIQPEDLFNVGDEVSVYVLRVDKETKKIALSIRRAAPEQWEQLITQYAVGDVIPGLITKLVPFGAFARLPGPVEGLVHVSEIVDRRIGHPEEVLDDGDVVPLKIVRIEHERHRLGLSLREARGEAEMRGWQFDEAGRVTVASDEAQEKFSSEIEQLSERYEARRAAQAAQADERPEEAEASSSSDDDGQATPAQPESAKGPVLTAMQAAMQAAQAAQQSSEVIAEEDSADESSEVIAEEDSADESSEVIAEEDSADESSEVVAEEDSADESSEVVAEEQAT